MTVTLAYIDENGTGWIGADSCASDSINHSICNNMKCFNPVGRRDVLIGCAGTFRLPNLLQFVPGVFPSEFELPTEKIDMSWLVNEFTPVLDALTEDFDDDDVWELLIAVNKKVYRVQMDLSIIESADCIDAIGIGGSVALGAFKVLNSVKKDMAVEERIKHALQVACDSCQGCQPPFLVKHTEVLPSVIEKTDVKIESKYSIIRHSDIENEDEPKKKKKSKKSRIATKI